MPRGEVSAFDYVLHRPDADDPVSILAARKKVVVEEQDSE